MYRSAEKSVDVELLAECGQIAQRLRSLESSWSIELKELQKRRVCSFGRPPLTASSSTAKRLNEIYELLPATTNNSSNNECSTPELLNHLRFLEDSVIQIHYQQELLDDSQRTNNKKVHQVHIKSNMNYSAAPKSNNNDLSTSSSSSLPTAELLLENSTPLSHQQQQQQQDLQTSIGKDNNNKNVMNEQDNNGDKETSSSYQQHQCCHANKQQLCNRITNDDLKLLLRELKRKVDYTEKMNWLCKLTIIRAVHQIE